MTDDRRNFLRWMTHGLGALWAAILGIPAVAYLIDARNRPARSGKLKTVSRLSELEVDKPKLISIRDVRKDAWTLHPNDAIGNVWLIRQPDSSVKAFTATCPHLGCQIDFKADKNLFVCPCHNGTFNADGSMRPETTAGTPNPAPRDMDSLKVELQQDPDPTHEVPDPNDPSAKKADQLVQVEYLVFYQGTREKKARQ